MEVPLIQDERYTPWPQPGPYRVDDYRRYDGDQPCELLYGRFLMTPAPSNRHQTLVILVVEVLMRASRASGGWAQVAPADVVLSQDTVVQPDAFYVSSARRSIVEEQETSGAPDIVVEVLSPGSRRRDRIEKLERYVAVGVPEYWIVDPEDRVTEFLVLDAEAYRLARPVGNVYTSPTCPEVSIDVAELWRDFERMAPGAP